MTQHIAPAPNAPAGTGKAGKITYWIATVWLALGMFSTGVVQLFKAKAGQGGADMVTHLGYPVYLLTLLGAWKVLGVIALLARRFSLLKEWAYAGFFFVMTGAIFSHIASGDAIKETLPSLLLLLLTLVSWYFRGYRSLTKTPGPAGKEIISVPQ